MGKSTSEISQELEQTRSDAAEKIGKIEEQVTQSAESVKESLDWRHQVEARPMLAVSAAFLGGMLLGGISGGGNGGSNGNLAPIPTSMRKTRAAPWDPNRRGVESAAP